MLFWCSQVSTTKAISKPRQPTSGSNYARRMGIHSPPSGHPQNKRWATSARRAGNECPNIETNLGQH